MVLVEIGVFILDEKHQYEEEEKTLRRRSQFRAINGGKTYTTHSCVCKFSTDHSLNPTNRVLGCHRVTNKAEEAPPLHPPLPNRLSPWYCVMQQGGSAATLMVVEEVVRRPVLEGLRVDDAAWQQRAADPLGCM